LFFIWSLFGRCYTQPMKIFNFGFLKNLLVIGIFSFSSLVNAGGIFSNASGPITTSPILPPMQMSVIGESMGNAVIGDGTEYNATSYNPALLGQAPGTLELLQLGVNFSNDDLTVGNYLINNSNNINNLVPTNLFQDLANFYASGGSNAAVNSDLNAFDSVVNNLANKSIAVGAGDNFAVKITPNVGIEIYDTTHAYVEVIPGAIVNDLLSIPVPVTQSSLQTSVTFLQGVITKTIDSFLTTTQQSQLSGPLTQLVNGQITLSQFAQDAYNDGVTNINGQAVTQTMMNQVIANLAGNLAYINALAYNDTVAMATVDFNPLEDFPLTVGINGKVVSREFIWASSAQISTATGATPLNGIQNDLETPTIRWGVDLGFLYSLEPNLNLGLSFTDLLAPRTTTVPNATVSTDILYGVITDPAPTVTSVGISWHPIHEISLNGDLDDLFSTTSLYSGSDLLTHVKLGASLNLAGIIQLRGGFSDNNFAYGAGLQLGFIGVDGSYTMDQLSQTYNYYGQLKIVF